MTHTTFIIGQMSFKITGKMDQVPVRLTDLLRDYLTEELL